MERLAVIVLMAIAFGGCNAGGNTMDTGSIDWSSLEFTCTKEKNPPFDEEADHWYRTARNLQKRDEERYATVIVGLYRQAIE